MMKVLIVGIAFAAASVLAYADGTQQQYEQAAVDAASLDPNEALVNDDGKAEDPNNPMSDRARAYRNGYYSGKAQAQKDQYASNNPPPLPPGMPPSNQQWTLIPPQPHQVAPAPARTPAVVASVPGAYAQVGDDGPHAYVGQPPARYVPQRSVTNVYVQAPQPVQPPQQYYAPPPPPQPYYEAPEAYQPPPGAPQSTYVVVQGVPPTLATGYWPRGYQPVYPPRPVRRYYYYQPY
jgi:hypothetical protein